MSKESLVAKVDFIGEMTLNIENIVKRHKTITKTLNDFEGQMAVMMGIAQIGETLKKLDDEIIQKYDLTKDRDGAYYTRNYIVHDYEGVDLAFIESIIRDYLPILKKKVLKIKEDIEKENN